MKKEHFKQSDISAGKIKFSDITPGLRAEMMKGFWFERLSSQRQGFLKVERKIGN